MQLSVDRILVSQAERGGGCLFRRREAQAIGEVHREAMARNNIGAARMELGEIDRAERDLRSALQNDTDYPIPYFNLAVIAYVRDEPAEGDRLIALAAEKGYSGGHLDRTISRVAAAYARIQARG